MHDQNDHSPIGVYIRYHDFQQWQLYQTWGVTPSFTTLNSNLGMDAGSSVVQIRQHRSKQSLLNIDYADYADYVSLEFWIPCYSDFGHAFWPGPVQQWCGRFQIILGNLSGDACFATQKWWLRGFVRSMFVEICSWWPSNFEEMTKLQLTFNEIFLWQERAAIRISQSCVKPALSDVCPIVFQFKVICCTNLILHITPFLTLLRTISISALAWSHTTMSCWLKEKDPPQRHQSHMYFTMLICLWDVVNSLYPITTWLYPHIMCIYIYMYSLYKHMSHVQKLDQIYSNMIAQYLWDGQPSIFIQKINHT